MREKASHTKSGNAAKLQGSSKQYRPSSRKQEKSEINNLKPEAVGEKRTNNTQS